MTRRAVAALMLLSLLQTPAWGFSSSTVGEALQNVLVRGRPADPHHDHGYRHKEITALALRDLGFSEPARKLLGWHNFLTDWDQYEHTPLRPPNSRYQPADHFDRNEGETSAEAFHRGLLALEGRRKTASGLLRRGRAEAGLAVMGRALHAVQDFHAHSNMVDLPEPDRRLIRSLLLGQAHDAPPHVMAALRLTGTSRHVMGDLAPAEDREPGYGHDAFSKDNVHKNAEAKAPAPDAPGRTKYQRAFELATEATRAFLLTIRDEAGASGWAKAQQYRPGP
ncbi:MAG: hypothetical protein ACK46X_14655 [Candidatus Sericytochromatia bacterium]